MWRAFLFLLLPGVLAAQPTHNSLLWRIEAPHLEAPSYLYGTVHTRDERAFHRMEELEGVIDAVQLVAGELDTREVQRNAMAVMARVMLPDGGLLKDLYKPREWQRLEPVLKERLGVMAMMVLRMKPFYVMGLLQERMMSEGGTESEHGQVLDEHILRVAADRGREVAGLETSMEQFAAIEVMPIKEQARMLLKVADGASGITDMGAMLDAYAREDLDMLMSAMNEKNGMTKALGKSLLTERNVRMAHRMDSIMRGGRPALYAVGAAHLPQADGIVALLQNKGYQVSPVAKGSWKPPNPPMEEWSLFRNDTLGYQVSFPAERRMKLQQGDPASGAHLVNWFTELEDGASFMVFFCQLGPEQASATDADLMLTLAGGSDRNPGRLLGMGETGHGGSVGTEAFVHFPEEDRYMRMWMVRPDNDKVHLLLVSPPQGKDHPLADAFFASFKLIGR